MTDKKKTLLWFLDDPQAQLVNDTESGTKQLIDSLVSQGNSQMLVLRQKAIEERFGVFHAATSLSQIDDGDLSQRLASAEASMSPLEVHHFLPKSRTNFAQMFHRPFLTAMYTKN